MATIFKLNPEPTFRVSVPIPVPGAADMELEVEFRHKTRDELQAFFTGFQDRTDVECLMEIVAGWHNCETPFSREALETLLQNYPKANTAILGKYSAETVVSRLGN